MTTDFDKQLFIECLKTMEEDKNNMLYLGRAVGMNFDSGVVTPKGRLESLFVKVLSSIMHDHEGYIKDFVFDNNYGKFNQMTVEQLYGRLNGNQSM